MSMKFIKVTEPNTGLRALVRVDRIIYVTETSSNVEIGYTDEDGNDAIVEVVETIEDFEKMLEG